MVINRKISYLSVKELCLLFNQYDLEFDVHDNHRVVDGKSLLGLYTLNFNNNLRIHIIGSENEIEKFILEIDKKEKLQI